MGERFKSDEEWTVDQWLKAYNISVGTVYRCEKCGAMIMVTKGGVGVLEPMRRYDPVPVA